MIRVNSWAVCWAMDSTFLHALDELLVLAGHLRHFHKRPQVQRQRGDRLTGLVVQLPGDPPAFLVLRDKAVARQSLVGLASLAQLLEDLRPFDGDPHLFPDGVQHVHVVAAEAAGIAAGHVDRAEDPVAGAQGDACKRPHDPATGTRPSRDPP